MDETQNFLLNEDQAINTIAQFQSMIRYTDKLPGHRIMVVGDIMVDEYIWGKVQRISPEAPVPVVHVGSETTQLGGAANVVNNLKSLEAEVELVGVVGDDYLGQRVIAALDRLDINRSGVVQSPDHQTIRKTRIVANNQQVVRVDRETVHPIFRAIEDQIVEHCLNRMDQVDGVIISDYAKGAVTCRVAQSVIEHARITGKVCAVDPKIKNVDNYAGCTILTPNHYEAVQMAMISIDEDEAIRKAGRILMEKLKPDALLVTCGEQGMALFEKDRPLETIDTVAQSVYDVTGAGDTVISALTLGLAAGLSHREAAVLANFAAGVVVGKVGTATVTIAEIKRAMKRYVA